MPRKEEKTLWKEMEELSLFFFKNILWVAEKKTRMEVGDMICSPQATLQRLTFVHGENRS